MPTKPKIYVSVTHDTHLTDEQRTLKRAIIAAIESRGLDLQIFHERGLPAAIGWSFGEADNLMRACDGAVVLAFAKWRDAKNLQGEAYDLPSEFNHFEGGLAVAHGLPLLIVTDQHVRTAGVTYTGGGLKVCFWPDDAGPDWARDPAFMEDLDRWANKAKARHRVFLGYCSGAKATANAVQLFIEKKLGGDVLNYALDFRAGPTILEQVSRAAETCSCALLLFTKDDDLGAGEDTMAPRDNVVFEAGYFLRAKGKNRVAIVREDSAKMPADLGGCVYIPLRDRTDTSTIETSVSDFLAAAL